MNSEDVQIRAARAQQLLEDEVLEEAFANLLKMALEAAITADLGNPTQCIGAVAAIKAFNDLQGELKSFVTSGKQSERKPFKVA